jgi:tRNA pseudouridine38-40 synthase
VHDFTSFKSTKATNPAKECVVYKAEAVKNNDEIIIEIIADRFLYNMIRTIVGTLLIIEKNPSEIKPEFMKEVLEAKNRQKAGPTVSPDGLTLMEVSYTDWQH